jgi:hypothetical protein
LSGIALAQNAPPSSNQNCNTPQSTTGNAQAQSPRCEDQRPVAGSGIPENATAPGQAGKTAAKGGQGNGQAGPGGADPAR